MNNATKNAIGPESPTRDLDLRDEPLLFPVLPVLPEVCAPLLDTLRFRVLMGSNLPAAFDYERAGCVMAGLQRHS